MSTSKPPRLIRVVLCDDHELFRHGLAEMLTTADDIEVVGEGNTHERAVAVVSEARPDVALLDLEMPAISPAVAAGDAIFTSHPGRRLRMENAIA
jgi:DNA-binding NarL/FixJ family response regulator